MSAVDTQVGKHIFENCIKDFLKDKICLLVTHQEQYLCGNDHVIIIINMGRIGMQGKYGNIINSHNDSLKRLSCVSNNDKETNQFNVPGKLQVK